jgi:hypothetical protein
MECTIAYIVVAWIVHCEGWIWSESGSVFGGMLSSGGRFGFLFHLRTMAFLVNREVQFIQSQFSRSYGFAAYPAIRILEGHLNYARRV